MTNSTTSSTRPVFSNWPIRLIAAIVLPILFATTFSQLVTYIFLRGPDGYFLATVVLWTALWAPSFFHIFFDRTVWRPIALYLLSSGISLAVLLPAILGQSR